MSGSYPPGVTGREYAIAGPDWEGEVVRTCTAKNVETTVLGFRDDEQIEVTLDVCPVIDMEVDAETYNGVLSWECPVCGATYQEDSDDGPDPDDARDQMLDRQYEDRMEAMGL